MIEFCTRKRMAIAILILVSISVLTIIAEGFWSTKHILVENSSEAGSNDSCPAGVERVLEECNKCLPLEMKMEISHCVSTGYSEKVKCQDGKEINRSCIKNRTIQQREFWLFQLTTLLIGVASYGIVKYRQRKLDKLLMEKVNRQIGTGS
ncbi:hypothetical protein CHS0354_009281 [Potamilus streckersoni]|uniref:Protein JTB n=1 Tax=Potamilus streckersoni TaxID=2493646 RepID=A0AAE0T7B3_9BIVA|nr:hypothetical protein CHS0354_009281 [Potamilus streckersoni]